MQQVSTIINNFPRNRAFMLIDLQTTTWSYAQKGEGFRVG
jgi:hypothetical protein